MGTTKPTDFKLALGFAHRLLAWYTVNARTMPWRVPPDKHAAGERTEPYYVWLSEVMLQQTQVATVTKYFLKFVKLWPDVEALARSDLEDVLKVWAGLGYYSRARNLKKCADTIVAEFGGRFPETFVELKSLPGIGDYTAAAIVSIAFDQAVPVLDGNVERVIARHRRIDAPLPKSKVEMKALLSDILDKDKPGEFAQATMDLGATICTPKKPKCRLCPVNQDCLGFKRGDMENFPVKLPKPEKPTRKGAAFILQNRNGDIFLCKRPDAGLLASMTQVPTSDWTARHDGATGAASAPLKATWKFKGTARHTFTHFHLELEVWTATVSGRVKLEGWWCDQKSLAQEALPTVMRKVLQAGLG